MFFFYINLYLSRVLIYQVNVKVWPPSAAQDLLLISLFRVKKIRRTVKRLFKLCVKLFRPLRLFNKRKKVLLTSVADPDPNPDPPDPYYVFGAS